MARPAYLDQLTPVNVPLPQTPHEIKEAVLRLVASPNIADKSWVTDQYDRYVRGDSVLSQPEDSGMIRIDEETNLGVAISTDANARWSYLDPYEGVKLALLESCRNIAVGGAKPLAITNCLNFGSPEDPGVMWQFAETVRGLADIALEMGLPVTGGNVSFYNQTGSVAILPTPVIGVLGVIQDVRTRTTMGIPHAGLDIYQLGRTDSNFSGSEWAYLHGQIGDAAPRANVDHEVRLVNLLLEGQPLFESAHDISDGGFAAAITEATLKHNVGATIEFTENVAAELFAQTPGRVIVSVEPGNSAALKELAAKHGIALTRLGQSGGDLLTINGAHIPLDELRRAHTETLPKLFG
jgi:phosphoribosylformylglycinamidine synthase